MTSIAAASLQNCIAKTIFAISNEESRYTLNGALLILKAESLAMVATDGHRLSHIEKSGETLSNVSVSPLFSMREPNGVGNHHQDCRLEYQQRPIERV